MSLYANIPSATDHEEENEHIKEISSQPKESLHEPSSSLYGDLENHSIESQSTKKLTTISAAPIRYDQPMNADKATNGKFIVNLSLILLNSNININNNIDVFKTIYNRNQRHKKNSKPIPKLISQSQSNVKITVPISITNLEKWQDSAYTDDAMYYSDGLNKRKQNKVHMRYESEEKDDDNIDWDENYDISRPNNYFTYLKSTEKYDEDDDWRIYLESKFEKYEQEVNDTSLQGNNITKIEATETPSFNQNNNLNTTQISLQGSEMDYDYKEETIDPWKRRPGQKSFASRLLKSYGWKPGMGLGANSTGITKALRFVPDKKGPRGHGKIIDKSKKQNIDTTTKMSKVIKLLELVSQSDLEDENLAGEIGSECGDNVSFLESLV